MVRDPRVTADIVALVCGSLVGRRGPGCASRLDIRGLDPGKNRCICVFFQEKYMRGKPPINDGEVANMLEDVDNKGSKVTV